MAIRNPLEIEISMGTSPINNGFSIAMFDYRKVYIFLAAQTQRFGVIGSVPDPSLGRLAGRAGPAIGDPLPCHAAGALQVPTGALGNMI